MSKQPIMEFKDIKQAVKYLKWWQKKLFLTDWIIKVVLVPRDEMEDIESSGTCNVVRTGKNACIRIALLTRGYVQKWLKALF